MVIVTKSSSSSLLYSAQSEMSHQFSFPHLSSCFYRVWIIVKQSNRFTLWGCFLCNSSLLAICELPPAHAMMYKHGHSTVSECDVECTQCITCCLS